MPNYRLARLVRTPSSEVYLVWDGHTRLGQADLHYSDGLVHGTVILEAQLPRSEVEALVAMIDDDIVSSYLPDCERDDFMVTVYVGDELLFISDTDGDPESDES